MTVPETVISSQEQAKPWVETPLKESYTLSKAAGCVSVIRILNRRSRIFLKLENLQPSGSFKSRGIGHYIQCRLAELPPSSRARAHVFASSGGNAGLAAVHASRNLDIPATVCVPKTTKPLMVSKLRAAGAREVIMHGATFADADAYLKKEVMAKTNDIPIYTPPFDHPDIWTGNSTVQHEILAQLPESPATTPTTIICSVGGGGLLNGICQSLEAHNLTDLTTVLAVETLGTDSLAQSVAAGQLVKLPGITSQATSLGAVKVSTQTLSYLQDPLANVRSVVLSDAEAAMGCWRLADDERIMVELACGVNVALCYDGRLEQVLGRKVGKQEQVVVVLCGGNNVTLEQLGRWREEFGWVVDEEREGGRRKDSVTGVKNLQVLHGIEA